MGAQQPQGQQTDPQEGQEPTGGADGGTQAQQPQAPANEPAGGTTEPQGGDGGATVNRHKYERDLKAKDDEIEKLRAQLDEAAKTKEGREELQKKLDEMKASMASEKAAYRLEIAGCKNVKAAKALLDDYEGDVDKLKEACPYLFEEAKKTGSTGLKPVGAAKDDDAALDRAFGLKK